MSGQIVHSNGDRLLVLPILFVLIIGLHQGVNARASAQTLPVQVRPFDFYALRLQTTGEDDYNLQVRQPSSFRSGKPIFVKLYVKMSNVRHHPDVTFRYAVRDGHSILAGARARYHITFNGTRKISYTFGVTPRGSGRLIPHLAEGWVSLGSHVQTDVQPFECCK